MSKISTTRLPNATPEYNQTHQDKDQNHMTSYQFHGKDKRVSDPLFYFF